MDKQHKSGPDSVYWLGSAEFSNEGAYPFRKFASPRAVRAPPQGAGSEFPD